MSEEAPAAEQIVPKGEEETKPRIKLIKYNAVAMVCLSRRNQRFLSSGIIV